MRNLKSQSFSSYFSAAYASLLEVIESDLEVFCECFMTYYLSRSQLDDDLEQTHEEQASEDE